MKTSQSSSSDLFRAIESASRDRPKGAGVGCRTFKGIQSLIMGEEGQDLVEYGLLLLLISSGAVAALRPVGTTLVESFNHSVSILFP